MIYFITIQMFPLKQLEYESARNNVEDASKGQKDVMRKQPFANEIQNATVKECE